MNPEPTFEIRNSLSASQKEDLLRLYANEWWTKDRTRSDVERMLAATDLLYALVDVSDSLVAFARVLTDRTYLALVLDVIVASEHRGRGLGQALLDSICSDPILQEVASIELVCQPEHVPFYGKWGFSENVGRSRLMRRTTKPALLGSDAQSAGSAGGALPSGQ